MEEAARSGDRWVISTTKKKRKRKKGFFGRLIRWIKKTVRVIIREVDLWWNLEGRQIAHRRVALMLE